MAAGQGNTRAYDIGMRRANYRSDRIHRRQSGRHGAMRPMEAVTLSSGAGKDHQKTKATKNENGAESMRNSSYLLATSRPENIERW